MVNTGDLLYQNMTAYAENNVFSFQNRELKSQYTLHCLGPMSSGFDKVNLMVSNDWRLSFPPNASVARFQVS